MYKVLIVINDKWYSDGKTFPDYHSARRAQSVTARTNWSFETAIGKGSDVLNFRESDYFEANMENERRQA